MFSFLRRLTILGLIGIPLATAASDETRIEELLHRQVFGPNDQTPLSETFARVRGCTIELELESFVGCDDGASYFLKTDFLDVRAIVTDKSHVKLTDFKGTRYESLEGAARYQYRPHYGRLLFLANSLEQKIRDEEYRNFPVDIDRRLEVLSKRYSAEIDPEFYSLSYKTTRFCSGVEIKSPLGGLSFSFFVHPSDQKEFVELIERLAQTCEHLPSS